MPAINWSEINWLAIAVAGFATFMLGGLWYTALFGKAWRAAHGFTEEHIKKAQEEMSPPMFFGLILLSYLAVSIGMAILLQWTGVVTLAGGAAVGAFVGLMIVGPIVFTNHLPSMVRAPGFLIDAAYSLIYCTMIGAILGAWR
jgi:hypothetical protein